MGRKLQQARSDKEEVKTMIFALKAQKLEGDRATAKGMHALEQRRSMGYLPSLLTETEVTILLQKLQFVSEFQSCK